MCRNPTTSWNIWVWSNHTSSLQLSSFHDDWSMTNVDIIINKARNQMTIIFNVYIVPNIYRHRKCLIRDPMSRLKHSVLTNFGVHSNSDWRIIPSTNTSKAKVTILSHKHISVNCSVGSNISWRRYLWYFIIERHDVAMPTQWL